ncbi:rCG24724 [Rattus norvegicus]|uniref:RCG24724 n=1 Tax=Rattus norvegicus TaxID=10116 RepID=A6JBU7_RAT|nr:rCG24724 [Rattus norvegicus]
MSKWPFPEMRAGTSVITPTTCLCTLGLGMQHSSTSLLCHPASQSAFWAKPCKSSSKKCWKKVGKSRLKELQLKGHSGGGGMPSLDDVSSVGGEAVVL